MSSVFCGRKPDSPPPHSSRIRLGALAFRSAASVHRGRVRNAEKRIHASGPAERQKTRNQILACPIEIAELCARYCHRPQQVLIPADPFDRTASRKRARRIFSISSAPSISASQPPDTKAFNPTLRIDRGKAASTRGAARGAQMAGITFIR